MLYTSKDRKPSSRSSLLFLFVVHSLMYLFDPSLASYNVSIIAQYHLYLLDLPWLPCSLALFLAIARV
jgi:hypothetical protein